MVFGFISCRCLFYKKDKRMKNIFDEMNFTDYVVIAFLAGLFTVNLVYSRKFKKAFTKEVQAKIISEYEKQIEASAKELKKETAKVEQIIEEKETKLEVVK